MKRSVLVVNDEIRFRELYGRTLSEAGLEVRTAASAEEALRDLDRATPDIVVTDVRMPGASGLDLLQTLRRRLPDLPFLLVTAFADVRDAVTALKLVRSSVSVALAVCLTLVIAVFVAKLVGSILPMVAKRFGLDPAVCASPVLTTIVDALTLLIYFRIATAMLGIAT
jgi:CheY-like chemotaxis protein